MATSAAGGVGFGAGQYSSPVYMCHLAYSVLLGAAIGSGIIGAIF